MRFSYKIDKFQTLGEYDYKFDEVGNVIADSSSLQFPYNYLCFPLMDLNYDTKAIETYYDVNFTEFESSIKGSETVGGSPTENYELFQENTQLKTKIDELIKLSESDSSIASNEVIKQVILDLRIALKQGDKDRDFSVDFPYMPKAIE